MKKKNINDLVEYYFETVVKERDKLKYGVLYVRSDNAQQEKFNYFYKKMFKKNAILLDVSEDFIQVFAELFVEACVALDELEDIETLKADDKLMNQRMRYIKDYISKLINVACDPNKKRIEVAENVKVNVILSGLENSKSQRMSINNLIESNNETVELVNQLNDENKIFGYGEKAYKNYFLQWFDENKEDVLTKKQYEKYMKLKEVYIANTDRSKEVLKMKADMYKDLNMTKQDFNKFKVTVKKRVVNKFNKVHVEQNMLGYSSKRRDEINQVFKDYIELADSNMHRTAQMRQIVMSKFVAENYDKYEEFEIAIIKDLSSDDKKSIVRCVTKGELLSHKLIRLIRTNVANYIEETKNLVVTPATQETLNYSERTFDFSNELEAGDVIKLKFDGTYDLVKRKKQDENLERLERNKNAKKAYLDALKIGEVKTYCLDCYNKGEYVTKLRIREYEYDPKGEKKIKINRLCVKCNESELNEYAKDL